MTKHAHSAEPLPLAAIWPGIRAEAEILEKKEPALAEFVRHSILTEKNITGALGKILSVKLASVNVSEKSLQEIFLSVYQSAPVLEEEAQHDLISIMKHDPAAHDLLTPFLFFKGFHALQSYRVGHWLWQQGRQHLALHLQNRISELFSVDIHPAAAIGHGVMMDHATGIVIGETTIVENDVLIWHDVTLGSRSLTGGDRHPKIKQGVHLGVGSCVLGNIEVGPGARVAAGSVVLDNVPPNVTVAGIPAKVVSKD